MQRRYTFISALIALLLAPVGTLPQDQPSVKHQPTIGLVLDGAALSGST